MIDFGVEEQYKKYEQVIERTVQAYEFWFHSIASTIRAYLTTTKK